MTIEELTRFSEQDFLDLHELMIELSDWLDLTQSGLKSVIEDRDSHIFVMRSDEGRVIGTATLCLYHVPSSAKAMIEDVVVSSRYRGRHLGRLLVEHLLDEAARHSPIELYLTSNPKRIEANLLYRSLGFEIKGTNFYKKTL